MATTKVWVGISGAPNAFGDILNWNETTAFANGDTYLFTNGAIDCTASLTHAYTGVTIKRTGGYTGKIGSASAPLAPTSATLVELDNKGGYTKIGGTITTLRAKIAQGSEVYVSSGTTTDMTVSGAGKITKEAAATITNARISQGAIYDAQGTNAHTLIKNCGTVTTTSNVGTYTGQGGDALTVRGTATATALNLTTTTTVNYQSSGTITLLEGAPGATFKISDSETLTGTLTITTLMIPPGFNFNRTPAGVSLTIGTETPVGLP